MVLPINRIFIDTNMLWPNWTSFSVPVSNILLLAKMLKIEVEIPQGTMVELGRKWRARTQETVDETGRSLEFLAAVVGKTAMNNAIPTMADLDAAYDKNVNDLLKLWGIQIAPHPKIALDELFSQAAYKEFVFGEKGVNFQDAVILHSCIERQLEGKGIGAILSDDGIFRKRSDDWTKYATTKNVNLFHLTVKDTEQYFSSELEKQGLLTQEDRDRYTRHKGLARALVVSSLPMAADILNESKRRMNAWDLVNAPDSWQPNLPLVEEVTFNEVVDVDVPRLTSDPLPGSELKLSAIVRGSALDTMHYTSKSGDERTFTQRKMQEVGFTALVRFNGKEYEDLRIQSMTYGWPSLVGSMPHAPV